LSGVLRSLWARRCRCVADRRELGTTHLRWTDAAHLAVDWSVRAVVVASISGALPLLVGLALGLLFLLLGLPLLADLFELCRKNVRIVVTRNVIMVRQASKVRVALY
jgi:hypothetical protein